MAYYRPGTHIKLKKGEFDTFTKVSNKLLPYIIAILAGYGFIDLMLRANGF